MIRDNASGEDRSKERYSCRPVESHKDQPANRCPAYRSKPKAKLWGNRPEAFLWIMDRCGKQGRLCQCKEQSADRSRRFCRSAQRLQYLRHGYYRADRLQIDRRRQPVSFPSMIRNGRHRWHLRFWNRDKTFSGWQSGRRSCRHISIRHWRRYFQVRANSRQPDFSKIAASGRSSSSSRTIADEDR